MKLAQNNAFVKAAKKAQQRILHETVSSHIGETISLNSKLFPIPLSAPGINKKDAEVIYKFMQKPEITWDGPNCYEFVEAFEMEFAKYIGTKYALMTPNGHTALHLILLAMGIGDGDRVIVPDATWIGSVSPALKGVELFAPENKIGWPDSNKLYHRGLTLPSAYTLKYSQQLYIIECLKWICKNGWEGV